MSFHEFSADLVSKEPDGSVVSADVGALKPTQFASSTTFGFLHKNLVNRIWLFVHVCSFARSMKFSQARQEVHGVSATTKM